MILECGGARGSLFIMDVFLKVSVSHREANSRHSKQLTKQNNGVTMDICQVSFCLLGIIEKPAGVNADWTSQGRVCWEGH